MFLSRKSSYGLKALVFLARQDSAPVMSREMAQVLDVPPHFLAKILQELSKNRILASVKGKNGGFRLAQPAHKIKLLRIVEVLEGKAVRDTCVLGSSECAPALPCPLRPRCASVRSEVWRLFSETSLQELAEKGEEEQDRGLTGIIDGRGLFGEGERERTGFASATARRKAPAGGPGCGSAGR